MPDRPLSSPTQYGREPDNKEKVAHEVVFIIFFFLIT
jgi:hypothetical protein